MPLIEGKSQKSFEKNVKTEVHHDKPLKQSLAIAYAMKRKAEHKKAEGGEMQHEPHMCHGGDCAHPSHMPADGVVKKMAEGGQVTHEGYESESVHPMVKRIMMSRGGMVANEHSGESTDEPTQAKWDGNEMDDLALDDTQSFDSTGANEGDSLGDAAEEHDREDIVSRIMRSRSKKDRMEVPGEGSTYGRRK